MEIIAVMIIFGIFASVVLQRYITLAKDAYNLAIDAAVSELNERETRAWAQARASSQGWTSDRDIWKSLITAAKRGGDGQGYPDLGHEYQWKGNTAPRDGKFYLSYKHGTPVTLTRTPSTREQPGQWNRA